MPRSDDPYLQPNGTLRNKLGITDQALLSLAEADLVAARAKLIELNLPRPPFSFDTLKVIHHELFQDVYTWAGQARASPIGKREYDDPTSRVQMFAAPDTIEARADVLFRALEEQNFLTGTSQVDFAAGATAVFAELNAIHFAREGNGRANRLLLSAMAANAGHTLAFEVITRERMIAVSVAAHEGDPSGVRRMFDEILDPRQVAAMRKAIDFLRDSTAPWNDLYISTTRAGQDYEGILVGRAGEDFMLQVKHGDDTRLVVGDASDLAADADSGSSVRFQALHFGALSVGTPRVRSESSPLAERIAVLEGQLAAKRQQGQGDMSPPASPHPTQADETDPEDAPHAPPGPRP